MISAINWLLQDNFAVNQLTSDKNYMIDKFINIIIEFTDLFRTFSDTVNNSDLEQGIEENDVFKFYKKMEASKKELINIIDNSSSNLFGFLIRHSSSEVLKNENRHLFGCLFSYISDRVDKPSSVVDNYLSRLTIARKLMPPVKSTSGKCIAFYRCCSG